MTRIIPLKEVTSALLPVQGSLPALLVSNGIFLVLVWGSVWLVGCGPNISRCPDSWGQVSCYHALAASAVPRAEGILRVADTVLMSQVETIEEVVWRHSFLENVAVHHEIVRACMALAHGERYNPAGEGAA